MKRILPLILLVFLLLFGPASAQDASSLESLTIELWPEYDQPNVLVLYTAVLSPSVSLPADVIFRIPVAAEGPHAVAVGPDVNSIADVVYEERVIGSWIEVSFIATTEFIRLEYYDPRLTMDGAQRSFTYDWPGNLAVDSMIINVQHPIGASDLRVSPTAGRVVNQSDGFTYNVIDLGEVGAGESFTLNLRYQKESDSLSINGLEIEPSVPFTSGAGLPPDVLQFLPWVLGTLGLVLIAGGGFWYWRLGRGTTSTRSRRRRKAGEPDGEVAGLDAIIYCHQCGKRADTGDRFCRSCGTRLRTE